MFEKKDLVFYLVIATIFVFLKILYIDLSVDDLRYFLFPLDLMVKLTTHATSVFLPLKGYYYPSLNIIIDKSCSGFNFFALCFMMLSFLSVNHLHISRYRTIAIICCLPLAYMLAIFANTARILTSITIMHLPLPSWSQHGDLTHQAQGAFVYLFFLIIIYLVFNLLVRKGFKNDAQPV